MPQHDRLVYLCLSKPGNFFRCEEDFNSYILVVPFPLPYFTVSALSDTSDQCYLLCYCSLNLDNRYYDRKITLDMFRLTT